MGKVILLVEDNPADEHLTLRAFRKLTPTDFVVAHDGAEALDYLNGSGRYAARPPELPAMVLLDLTLPRIDGLEVLKRIRANERTRRLPVVIFSGSSAGEDKVRSYAFGATAYVQKPVSFDEFVEAAEALWRLWQQLEAGVPIAEEQCGS
jgi:two-component system response regulator